MVAIALLACIVAWLFSMPIERLLLQRFPRVFVRLAWIPAARRIVALPPPTTVELARHDEIATYRDRPGSAVDLERVRAMRQWSTRQARGEFASDLSRGWIVERAPGDASLLLARFAIRVAGDRVEIRTRIFANGAFLRAPLHALVWLNAVATGGVVSIMAALVVSVVVEAIAAAVNIALQQLRVARVLDRIATDLEAGGTFRATATHAPARIEATVAR